MRDSHRALLMLVTDPRGPSDLGSEVLTEAVAGGADLIQVRAPAFGARDLLEMARRAIATVRPRGARVVVNDRVDVAMAADADGVHLKRSSLSPSLARKLLGPGRLVGVSTHTIEEVDAAFAEGADYVVFGPVFATPSKVGIIEPRGPEGYRRAMAAARRRGPVLAIGGVGEASLPSLLTVRPDGVAVIRAILGAEDPRRAAARLRSLLDDEGVQAFEEEGR